MDDLMDAIEAALDQAERHMGEGRYDEGAASFLQIVELVLERYRSDDPRQTAIINAACEAVVAAVECYLVRAFVTTVADGPAPEKTLAALRAAALAAKARLN